MRICKFLATVAMSVLLICGCASETVDSEKQAFIGTWIGQAQHEDHLDTWVQKRFDDGTYFIVHVVFYEGDIIAREIESGAWWLEGGRFYEISNSGEMARADEYDYNIISEDKIFFQRPTLSYSFTDTRIPDSYWDILNDD